MLDLGVIKLFKECFADASALLIDGVFGWISNIAYADSNVAFDDAVGNLLVDIKQLNVVVAQFFEKDAFGVF